MVEQQPYIASVLSPSDALSEDTPSLSDGTRSSTSSYPDLTPYSAVRLYFRSSFTIFPSPILKVHFKLTPNVSS